VHAKRKHGLYKASIYDFHSLRTTWITEALSRGVPIETVKLISGHKTVEVVTTHYFHPDRDQVRNALQNALPSHLTGNNGNGHTKLLGDGSAAPGAPSEALERALALLAGVTGKGNQDRVAEVVEHMKRAKEWVDARVVREPEPANV